MQLTWKSTAILVGVAVIGGLYLEQKAKAEILAAANDVNPLNKNNIEYSTVNKIGAAVTGTKSWDLGHAIFCWIHPSESICNPAPSSASSVSQYLSGLLGVPICH